MLNPTPFIKCYSTFRLGQLNKQRASDLQKAQLLGLLHKAQSTQFGRQYHFKEISTVEDYQRRVPLRTYSDFRRDFWGAPFPELIDCTWPGKIPFFALSSGTTSDATKHIPVSRDMIRSNARASFDLFCHHVKNNPRSQIFGGKGCFISGLVAPRQLAQNVYEGLMTDIMVHRMPWWARPWHFPPPKLRSRLKPDWEEKLKTLARESLRQDIRAISGFPSLLLMLCKQLEEERPCGENFRLVDYFPRLEMLVHGGVSLTPYLTQFSRILEGSHCELREIYPSSEGFFAIADRRPGKGLRLLCDHGIFYEFVPFEELGKPDPERRWIDNVQIGTNYAVVLSTCAGLWGYILGDVIEFVDLDPPRLLISGRTSNTLSILWEKVVEEEVCRAVADAADTIGVPVTEFSVSASYSQELGDLGRYRYLVEFQHPPERQEDMRRFIEIVEQSLCRRNAVYRDIRLQGNGLDAPELCIAAPGTFLRWLKQKGKLDGKVPRIMADTEKFNALVTFAQEYKS